MVRGHVGLTLIMQASLANESAPLSTTNHATSTTFITHSPPDVITTTLGPRAAVMKSNKDGVL